MGGVRERERMDRAQTFGVSSITALSHHEGLRPMVSSNPNCPPKTPLLQGSCLEKSKNESRGHREVR